MAEPLGADRLVKILRARGLTVHEVRDWRHHNRNSRGPWGPVHGVMIHHTATRGTDATVRLCYEGHSELPGPLCHGVIDKRGELHLVGNGRANHAGKGDGDVLRAVVRESALPPDNQANTDGNSRFYGFECVNLGDGDDPWPDPQVDAAATVAAAICHAHGWTQRSVIGHLEWQPGKIDPRGFTMGSLRRRVQERLARLRDGTAEDGEGEQPPGTPRDARLAPFPGRRFFREGRHDEVITAMGRRLVAEDCGRYREGPGPEWTDADRTSYAAWQRKLGRTGEEADGVPDESSWERLRVPRT